MDSAGSITKMVDPYTKAGTVQRIMRDGAVRAAVKYDAPELAPWLIADGEATATKTYDAGVPHVSLDYTDGCTRVVVAREMLDELIGNLNELNRLRAATATCPCNYVSSADREPVTEFGDD